MVVVVVVLELLVVALVRGRRQPALRPRHGLLRVALHLHVRAPAAAAAAASTAAPVGMVVAVLLVVLVEVLLLLVVIVVVIKGGGRQGWDRGGGVVVGRGFVLLVLLGLLVVEGAPALRQLQGQQLLEGAGLWVET